MHKWTKNNIFFTVAGNLGKLKMSPVLKYTVLEVMNFTNTQNQICGPTEWCNDLATV